MRSADLRRCLSRWGCAIYTTPSLEPSAQANTRSRPLERNRGWVAARGSLSGRVLAKRWTLLKTLGVGGTGTVYEAVHRNGRHVAVKVLHPELANHPTVRRRFLSEGYAANRVRHPNAVAVLDDGEEADGTAFLVLELLEGESLARVLAERGALSIAEVSAVALSVLDVLATAHDNGVVHRDVKPANIFWAADNRIKLLDFGVALVAELAATSVVTQTGATVGTPAFMAPEQAAGRSAEVDALTDIWAVGATMFQLLTQRLVHDVSSSNAAVVAAATTPAVSLRSVLPGVPPPLAHVVDRALAFERSERWPNARAMHQALRDACSGAAIDLGSKAIAERPGPDTLPEHTLDVAFAQPAAVAVRAKWVLASLVAAPLLVMAAWTWKSRQLALVAPASSSAQRVLVTQPEAIADTPAHAAAQPDTEPAPRSALPVASSGSRVPNQRTAPSARLVNRAHPAQTPAAPHADDTLLDRRK